MFSKMRCTVLSCFFAVVLGLPAPQVSDINCELNNLTSPYTLTAYDPENPIYNGLKVNNFNVFQVTVAQYCPSVVQETGSCPNGTDMAFVGTLNPLSMVPGGQDSYVAADGRLEVTPQHSHSFPDDSFPAGLGWTWTALPVYQPSLMPNCPPDNSFYNCAPPTGYFQFKAPNATIGGVVACTNPYNANVTSLYAITPSFNQTGCTPLLSLGTHPYSGPTPPVWSYY